MAFDPVIPWHLAEALSAANCSEAQAETDLIEVIIGPSTSTARNSPKPPANLEPPPMTPPIPTYPPKPRSPPTFFENPADRQADLERFRAKQRKHNDLAKRKPAVLAQLGVIERRKRRRDEDTQQQPLLKKGLDHRPMMVGLPPEWKGPACKPTCMSRAPRPDTNYPFGEQLPTMAEDKCECGNQGSVWTPGWQVGQGYQARIISAPPSPEVPKAESPVVKVERHITSSGDRAWEEAYGFRTPSGDSSY